MYVTLRNLSHMGAKTLGFYRDLRYWLFLAAKNYFEKTDPPKAVLRVHPVPPVIEYIECTSIWTSGLNGHDVLEVGLDILKAVYYVI